ncbi:thioredoxin [SAR202 cluster bacterium AD-804-J14_MRT_500m]|nr:thioredoxin [SAR202 cluster bacterium AD-804-J14_MRT_500m]
MPKPFAVTDADFQEKVINSSNPVLVDFWADWCTPCKMIAPIVDELAEELDGRVEFAKVDVDSNPETAISYGIRSIPALIVFKDGKPVEQIIGAVPKDQIRKKLDAVLDE